ncbi:hypothetical protein V6N11_023889 [Hibiscus sabdariffa]|uniref:Uncharacterized protein n=1 Tax=Hibiscus sabdariffa TaxID=183260 RepID=A0ABR2TNS7_9ROSI
MCDVDAGAEATPEQDAWGAIYQNLYLEISITQPGSLLSSNAISDVIGRIVLGMCSSDTSSYFHWHNMILWFISAEQGERDKARVLVHCMSGKNRSPAIVIAFLMKSKGWRLPQSYQWVKERRPSVDINQAIYQQLQEYEQKLFGSSNNNNPASLAFQPAGAPFNVGFSK